jgi:hypothetical protein
MTAVIIVIVLIYAAFHVGAGHAHYRHRRAQGLSPNFYWSSVRGPYARDDYEVGTLVWQVCRTCGIGTINKISLSPEWRARGLADDWSCEPSWTVPAIPG